MTPEPLPPPPRRMEKLTQALRLCCFHLPQLSGLAYRVQLMLDRRVETAAVFSSGRILFNPGFLDRLTLQETTFVMAHEIYHLVLQTHDRRTGEDFKLVNDAHDLMINDILEEALGIEPPAGGLRCRGARHSSLERLVLELKKNPVQGSSRAWKRARRHRPQPPSAIARALTDAGLIPSDGQTKTPDLPDSEVREKKPSRRRLRSDVLTRKQELALFPGDDPADLDQRTKLFLELSVQSLALSELQHTWERDAPNFDGRVPQDRLTLEIAMLRGQYRTPWERAVQSWLDSQMPQPRT